MPGVARTASTPKPIARRLRVVRDYAYDHPDAFIETHLKVVGKRAQVFPFRYTWSQNLVAKTIKLQNDARRPVRLYIVKSRQVGLSTLIAARFFTKTWAKDNIESLIFAHQEIRAKELLGRIKYFWKSLPQKYRLELAQDSKDALQFADTRGILNIATAKNFDAVVGGTKQHVLITEFSRFKKAMTILAGLSHPVEREFGTEIIIETTGRGHGSEAHNFYKSCKAGREFFESIFLKWQEDPGCNYIFESAQHEDDCMQIAYEYEPRLQQRQKHFQLTNGQTYFAYRMLRDVCYGDYEEFLENYPCDDEECWRSTGSSFFGDESLNELKPENYPFKFYVYSEKHPIDQLFTDFSQLTEVENLDENGKRPFFKVWKWPRRDGWYVVSGDSAEGEEDGNSSSSFVIDMETFEMMAEFHGKIVPSDHARVIASLCSIYNDAMAAPEFNPPGNVTLDNLKRIWHNIYRWRYVDDHKLRLSNKLGWQTQEGSRARMLHLAKRIVNDVARDQIRVDGIIRSKALVDEMKTFITGDDGKPEAAPNCEDDRVMAWAIALIVSFEESYGSGRDIFSHYKKFEGDEETDGENLIWTPDRANANINLNGLEPSEVIRILSEGGNNYGRQLPTIQLPDPFGGEYDAGWALRRY